MSNYYAEGVDLKIAEKYRIPPRISVPREVIAHVSGDHYKEVVANPETEYDFNLERNVIRKIEEWKRVHDQTEHVRQEQLRARDRERRQQIEQEQKHLLNQVSYADLSSDDDDDDGEEEKSNKLEQQKHHPEDDSSSSATSTTTSGETKGGVTTGSTGPQPSASTVHGFQRDFSTILQPTVVPESSSSFTRSVANGNIPLAGSDSNKTASCDLNNSSSRGMPEGNSQTRIADLNYSDWESDNYSPFDRMELKSINDLDILAQVLQTTQLNNNKALDNNETQVQPTETPPSPPASPVDNSVALPSETEALTLNGPTSSSVPVQSQPMAVTTTGDTPSVVNNYSWTMNNHIQQSPHQPQSGSIEATAAVSTNTFPTATTYQPVMMSHQMDYGQQQQQTGGGYFNHNTPSHHHQYQQSNIPSYLHSHTSNYPPPYQSSSVNYYHPAHQNSLLNQHQHHQHHQQQHQSHVAVHSDSNGQKSIEDEEKSTAASSLLRSRSKSVPDIVHELEEEVKASEQRRRVRNHSQCNKSAADSEERDDEVAATPPGSDAFERLPQESKELAIKISRMGFSVNIVATVIEQLGNDDKKIIEHLIPLNELLDLGFGISPTSEALLKFNNNRERALDFLIS